MALSELRLMVESGGHALSPGEVPKPHAGGREACHRGWDRVVPAIVASPRPPLLLLPSAQAVRGEVLCSREQVIYQAGASAMNSGEAGRQENLATMLQEKLRAEGRLPWSLESNACSSTSVSRTPLNRGPRKREGFPET